MLGSLQHFKNALFGHGRGKNNGEIGKRSHTVADGILECIDNLLRLFLHQVPFVHHHNQRLVVFLNQLEDVHILRLNAACGINHQDANIAVLNGTDASHHTIELQVFGHFVLATDAGSVDQIEIKTELIVSRIDAVTGCSGNIGHYMAILTDKGIDKAALSNIRAAYNRKTGDAFLQFVGISFWQLRQDHIQQIASTAACCRTDADGLT